MPSRQVKSNPIRSSTSRLELIRDLSKALPVEEGPPGLVVKTKFFDRRRKSKDEGSIILEAPNDIGTAPRKLQIGSARLTIHHKEGSYRGFRIAARSAVLWDIQIYYEDERHKGIGFEWLGIIKEYAKSRKSERFYAWDVQSQAEGFFAKAGFVPTDDADWWIAKEF